MATIDQAQVIARSRLAQAANPGQPIQLPTRHWITALLKAEFDYRTTAESLKEALRSTIGKPIFVPHDTITLGTVKHLVKRHPNQRMVIFENAHANGRPSKA